MQELLKSECFTEKWLKNRSKELSGDPVLFEKIVHAFALLGYLVQLEEDFIFKGGISLLLHVPQINRLSIDIDITYGGETTEFVNKLKTIPGKTPFSRLEENERGYRGLPNPRQASRGMTLEALMFFLTPHALTPNVSSLLTPE